MYILIVLFHFPQKGTKGREVLWDTSHCSHGEVNLQMLFYHSIKIHTGVWKKQRSSEWLSWRKYVKYNQVFFLLKTVAPCVPENQSFIATCHRNRNLSGGFLWACRHTSVSEELLPWEMWATQPRSHHARKEDMHSGSLSQLPLQTPVNWLHPIQAALKRVCGSIKEVTL